MQLDFSQVSIISLLFFHIHCYAFSMKKFPWMVLISFMLTGCIAPGVKDDKKPDMRQQDNAELASIYTGMSITRFRKLFPDASFVGYSDNQAIYLIEHSYYTSDSPETHYREATVYEKLRFHFQNGRLVQWDLPSNWNQQTNINYH